MKAFSYDVNLNAFPEGIEFTYDLPQIYFFPAYHKRPPYQKYIGNGLAGQILLWIQKQADIKFTYPVDVSKVGMPRDDLDKEKEKKENKEESQVIPPEKINLIFEEETQ